MMVLVNFDFWGSDEDLKKLDSTCEKMTEKTYGVEFIGRFMPEQKKWHYTYFYKADSLTAWDNALKNFEYEFNKKILSHNTTEFYIQ